MSAGLETFLSSLEAAAKLQEGGMPSESEVITLTLTLVRTLALTLTQTLILILTLTLSQTPLGRVTA